MKSQRNLEQVTKTKENKEKLKIKPSCSEESVRVIVRGDSPEEISESTEGMICKTSRS